jgi:hypothetical protein
MSASHHHVKVHLWVKTSFIVSQALQVIWKQSIVRRGYWGTHGTVVVAFAHLHARVHLQEILVVLILLQRLLLRNYT